MKPPEAALHGLVEQWLAKAGADPGAAEQLSRLPRESPHRFGEIIAFHCQQAVEKYLKAFLVRHQIEFSKTHDISKLLQRVATVSPEIAESLREADFLTPFGVEMRYPGDSPEILHGGEAAAVEMAERARVAIMASLKRYLDRGPSGC